MYKLVVAALIALAVARPATLGDPTKPSFAVNYFAEVDVEAHHEHDPTIFGEGVWLVDSAGQKSLEDYRFKVAGRIFPFLQYNLQRFDLGKQYEIDSFNRGECKVRVLNGTLTNPWSFLDNATYEGQDDFRHFKLDLWGVRTGGIHIQVGVSEGDVNTPITLSVFSEHGGNKIFFREFHANPTFDQKYFEAPSECNSSDTSAVTASTFAPVRPVISDTFSSEFEHFDEHGPHRYEGNGKWARDAKLQAEVHTLEYQEPGRHEQFFTYTLELFKEHKAYHITSENKTDCMEQPIRGNFTNPFAWIADSKFVGEHTDPRHGVVDIWEYTQHGLNLTVGVHPNNTHIPLFLARSSPAGRELFIFDHFDPQTPNPSFFDVPSECH